MNLTIYKHPLRLLNIGLPLLEFAIPFLLERHPSLIHIQNVIHKDYVSLLRNGISLNPRALRFATTAPKDALAFGNACDENLIGLIGLFGYCSLEEAKIELSPE